MQSASGPSTPPPAWSKGISRRSVLGAGTAATLAAGAAATLGAAPSAAAAGTSISGFYDVTAYGAKGDGTTDDTSACQKAINAAGAYGLVWFPAGTYLISSALTPQSDQTLFFSGALQPKAANTLLALTNVLNVHMIGELRVEDPSGVSGSGAPIVTITGCRNCYLERAFFDNCATCLKLENTNQCDLDSLYCQSVRSEAIQIVGTTSDPAGVHDNSFGHVFISGASGSANGIDFNVQLGTNVVGGNHFGDVSVLGMGGAGVSFGGGGQIEVWFDTLLADTNSGDGVYVGAGTQRLFFGTLWASTNGNNGLETIGSGSALVQDIQIGSLYAHNNTNYGVLVNGYTERLLIGQLICQHNGLSGFRVVNHSSRIHVSQTVTYGNSTSGGHYGVDDGGDSSSSYLWFYQMDATDGYSLSAATNVKVD